MKKFTLVNFWSQCTDAFKKRKADFFSEMREYLILRSLSAHAIAVIEDVTFFGVKPVLTFGGRNSGS